MRDDLAGECRREASTRPLLPSNGMQMALRPNMAGIDWIPGDDIPWVCAQCWLILGPSSVPQSVALRKLHEHLATGHIQEKVDSAEDQDDLEDEHDLDGGEDGADDEDEDEDDTGENAEAGEKPDGLSTEYLNPESVAVTPA